MEIRKEELGMRNKEEGDIRGTELPGCFLIFLIPHS